MWSTIVVFGSFLSLAVASLLLWAGALFLGLRWAGAGEVKFRRVLLFTVGLSVLVIAIRVGFYAIAQWQPIPQDGLLILVVGLDVAVALALIQRYFDLGIWPAARAWLPTLAASVVGALLVWFVMIPFVAEAYKIPTNGMAPALWGNHVRGTCPRCGATTICSVPDEYESLEDGLEMVCTNELTAVRVAAPDSPNHGGDRIIASKFLTPRRWDIIVFRFPAIPEENYVKRLVGLPGETIYLKDGDVWINGKKHEPPVPLNKIEYLTEIEDRLGTTRVEWGHAENPITLGPDEYFVLGDFSARSYDSRYWTQGAAGYPPYAVPEDHIIGVVTHIYWPPSRWRILR